MTATEGRKYTEVVLLHQLKILPVLSLSSQCHNPGIVGTEAGKRIHAAKSTRALLKKRSNCVSIPLRSRFPLLKRTQFLSLSLFLSVLPVFFRHQAARSPSARLSVCLSVVSNVCVSVCLSARLSVSESSLWAEEPKKPKRFFFPLSTLVV